MAEFTTQPVPLDAVAAALIETGDHIVNVLQPLLGLSDEVVGSVAAGELWMQVSNQLIALRGESAES